MAELTQSGLHKRKYNKHKRNKTPIRVDLTPMVDLAFLLITFFMLTTRLTDLKAMELIKRVDDKVKEPVSDCQVLQILVDSFDRAYTYEGQDLSTIRLTIIDSGDKLEKIIKEKMAKIPKECRPYPSGKPRELMCLIKLLPGARYKNLVDVMDEMAYTKTTTYSVQDPLPEEIDEIKAETKKLLAKAR